MTGQSWFGFTVAVEAAWGADLTTDPATWVWTDVTAHVRQDPGLSWSYGRDDEASTTQPAKADFVFNNTTGAYTLGPQSSNYPNIRRGTPFRVRVDPDGAGFVTAIQGAAVGFTPSWDTTGRIATAALSAAGALRRLGQGASPAFSPLRRSLAMAPSIVAYWPCEDGKAATWFAAGLDGVPHLQFTGSPDMASNTSFLGSDALPVLRGSWWIGGIPTAAGTGNIQVRALVEFPSGDTSEDRGVIWTLWTSGTAHRWDLEYIPGSGGELNVAVYDDAESLITESGAATIEVNSEPRARRFSLGLTQVGADIVAHGTTIGADGIERALLFTVTSRTVGSALRIDVNGPGQANAAGALDQVAVGHVTVQTITTSATDALDEMTGYAGEYVDTRLERLFAENGESLTIPGQTAAKMGPQSIGTLLELARECEAVDQGILFDGQADGLSYVCREDVQNRLPVLTLDATARQVAVPIGPVDDDQRTVNKSTVTRTRGTTTTVADTSGPLGTDAIGAYETSETINCAADGQTGNYAGWFVHLGTQGGYRHPTVTVDLRANPTLARDWLAIQPGSRVDITGLSTVFVGYPTGTVSLFVEGVAQSLGANRWVGTLKCSPYDAWNIGVLGTAVASPISFVGIGTAASASSGSITPSIPALTEAGDLMLVFASTRNSGTGTVNTPSGWTALATSGNTIILGRIATTLEHDPTVTFTGGAANETVIAQMAAFRGTHQDIDQVVLNSAVQLNSSAANIAYPALTVASDNCAVVVAGWKQDDWTSVAALAGMTEIEETAVTAGSDAGQVWDYVIQSTAANIGASSFTVTGGTSQISRGITLALKPNPEPNLTTARLDTPGSTLATSFSAGATSMSVATTDAATITYVAIGAAASANNASVVPALPTGWAAGDLLLVFASIRNSGTGTVDTPAGWNNLVTTGNFTLLGRHAESGDTAPTVTFTGGVANATTLAQCLAVRGTNKSIGSVVHASATQLNGASSTTVLTPGLTVTEDGCIVLVAGWKQTTWTSVSTFGGATEISDTSISTGDDAAMFIDYVIETDASNLASNGVSVTGAGASAISRAIVVAIRPYTGTRWTTTATDYPIDLDVGGLKVTATACTDVSSPQTMTIGAAGLARTAGAAVQLWRPPVLSL